jgi:DnaK suppressor protein
MDRKSRESFAAELRRRRDELCREVADAEHDLSDLAENQDPEFEERGREETDTQVLDRLDNRGKHEIEEIDAALLRIADGSYGACIECGEKIAIERLRAVAETELCVDCAAQAEASRRRRAVVGENETPARDASDEEKEILLYDRLREDGRIEIDELEFACRHGVLHLSGTLPDALQHQLLRELVLEIGCFGTTVDHVEIRRIIEADETTPESEEE